MRNTTEYTFEELADLVKASNQKMLEFAVKNHDYKFELVPEGEFAAKVVVTKKVEITVPDKSSCETIKGFIKWVFTGWKTKKVNSLSKVGGEYFGGVVNKEEVSNSK